MYAACSIKTYDFSGIAHILLEPGKCLLPGVPGGFGVVTSPGVIMESMIGTLVNDFFIDLVVFSHRLIDCRNPSVNPRVKLPVDGQYCRPDVGHIFHRRMGSIKWHGSKEFRHLGRHAPGYPSPETKPGHPNA